MNNLFGKYKIVSGPSSYVVSLSSAKNWLRIYNSDDDDNIKWLISASYCRVEDDCSAPLSNYTLQTSESVAWSVKVADWEVDGIVGIDGVHSSSYTLRNSSGKGYIDFSILPTSSYVSITFSTSGSADARQNIAILKDVADLYETRTSETPVQMYENIHSRERLIAPYRKYVL